MMSYRRISILTNTTSEKYYHYMLHYYQADKLCIADEKFNVNKGNNVVINIVVLLSQPSR